ncbi:MAG: LytR family transcriptional regulator, partial [Leifsonia sp.]|nr:LytR family transcriptional regulator [Leifsonia sp.]
MTIASPLRYPDTGSARIMTKRGWWLVGLNLLAPGSAQVVAGNRILGRVGLLSTLILWLLGLAALVVSLFSPATLYMLFTQALSL